MDRETLEQFGIEPEYEDTWGRRHAPSEEAVQLILGAERAPSRDALPATVVVRQDQPVIPLRLPEDRRGSRIRGSIDLEDGGRQEFHTTVTDGGAPLPGAVVLGYHRLALYWGEDREAFATLNLIVCPRHALAFEGRAA